MLLFCQPAWFSLKTFLGQFGVEERAAEQPRCARTCEHTDAWSKRSPDFEPPVVSPGFQFLPNPLPYYGGLPGRVKRSLALSLARMRLQSSGQIKTWLLGSPPKLLYTNGTPKTSQSLLTLVLKSVVTCPSLVPLVLTHSHVGIGEPSSLSVRSSGS